MTGKKIFKLLIINDLYQEFLKHPSKPSFTMKKFFKLLINIHLARNLTRQNTRQFKKLTDMNVCPTII